MDKIVNKDQYRTRIVDKQIEELLKVFGAICIEGPKWCGKTWTSSLHSKSEFLVGSPSNNFSNRLLAETEPNSILEGDKPRLIDEWQEVPLIWDATRAYVDNIGKKGQLILTGSSTPTDKGILHSGTGRIGSLRMSTMSLFESGDSSGLISLRDLCNNKFESKIINECNLEKLAYLIVRGGWPGNLETDENQCNLVPSSYMDIVSKTDLKKLDKDIDYKEHKAKLILKSLARNESTTASNLKILDDIIENDTESINKVTLSKYLNAFDRMFLTNNIEPFSPNIRSSLRVKQKEKRHFVDPSLACAVLNLTPKKLMNDLYNFGFLFESLVERDLSIYAQANKGKLFHYQDYKDNEIDSIIELDDGSWCAFEIKLGLNKAEEGAENLDRVCNKIVSSGGKEPLIKCVIYGVGNAIYKNNKGVYIIPITALKD